jgi:hypothetical protein
VDFSSAYNDGFYNASNHPNYNAFATLPTNGSIMAVDIIKISFLIIQFSQDG